MTSEYKKKPEDQKIVQKSLKVSEQMVNLLKEIKASDNAIQQNLRKTGDPLVYDDGSITVEETTDPGKQVSNSNSDLKDKTPIPSKHHNLATVATSKVSTDTSKRDPFLP